MKTSHRNHTTTTITALTALAAALALVGCAASEEPADGQPLSATATADPAPARDLPCGVATAAEVEGIVGSPVGEGDVVTSNVSENDVEWTPQMCRWRSDDLDVEVRIADAAAFTGDELVCQEPIGIGAEVSPVDGLGVAAWWQAGGISDAEGMLRVCTDTLVIDVSLEAEDGDPEEFRAPLQELTELILDRV